MSKKMLFLRTCDKDMRARGGFQWPLSGPVDCPDWVDNHECGHGLHGLLNGAGHSSYLDLSIDAMWVVFEADHANGIPEQNPDKYKVPVAHVVCVGDRKTATDYLIARGCDASKMIGAYITGGDRSTLTGGDYSTLTGGDGSILTGGDGSTLTGGDDSTLTWKVWDGKYYRLHTVYTGEDGIKPDTPYQFVNGGFQMQGESHA